MKCCDNPRTSNFSFKDSNNNLFTHIYCSSCKSHQYGEKIISRNDWEEWINHPGVNGEYFQTLDEFTKNKTNQIV